MKKTRNLPTALRHSLAFLLGVAVAVAGSAAIPAHATLQSRADFSPDAYEQASKLSLGVELGTGILSNSGGSNIGYGANAGYRFHPYWGAGLFLNRLNRGTFTQGGQSADANLTFFGADINYFVSWIPGLQAGGKLALGRNAVNFPGLQNTDSNLYYGPSLSYDYPLGGGVTLGGEGSLLYAASDDANDVTSLMAALKIWL